MPAVATAMQAAVARLLAGGSVEMGAHRAQDAAAIAALLPAGTPVYVNHLPRHTLADTLAGIVAVRNAGLEPVPHIAARRITSREEFVAFLRDAVRHAAVSRLLLLGGDLERPVGPFADAAALLSEDVLAGSGITDVAFAAYPERHPHIATSVLVAALSEKIAIARRRGLRVRIVTQFSFSPERIVALAADLQRRHADVPVHIGLAGPANPVALLKFARVCGVSASLKTLASTGFGALRLATHAGPGAEFTAIAQRAAAGALANVAGVHLFSFGGTAAAASWLRVAPEPLSSPAPTRPENAAGAGA
jgi:methylenetetrahydrofolate reductase (NADPH)